MQFTLQKPTDQTLSFPNFFGKVFNDEYEDLVRKASSSVAEEITEQYKNKLPSAKHLEQLSTVLMPINFETQEAQQLAKEYSYANGNFQHCTNADALLKQVTQKIILIEKEFTFIEALEVGETWIKALGKHFYGILLRNGDTLLNPYHPVTATVLANDPSTKKYKVVVYPYPDRESYDKTSLSLLVNSSETKIKVINLLRALTGEITTTRTTLKTLNVFKNYAQGSFTQILGDFVKPNFVREPNNDNSRIVGKETLLVATQVLANGVAAPYYATTILVRKDSRNKSQGLHLGMCRSVNVSSNEHGGFDSVQLGSVCVGSTDGYTDKSLATLNHANLGSPYQRFSIAPGFTYYVDYCVYFSRQIYKAAGLISTEEIPEPEEYTVLSRKELAEVYEPLLANVGPARESISSSQDNARRDYGWYSGVIQELAQQLK